MENSINSMLKGYNVGIFHHPLIEWGRISHDLNKMYKDYGIGDDDYGLNIKNTARHFTGGALGNKYYGLDITSQLGNIKEFMDLKRDAGKSWLDDDTFMDKVNNQRGMAYSLTNPKATRQEIYRAAIEQAIKNYNADYPQK